MSCFLISIPGNSQWVKEKGKSYIKLNTWHLLADKHFTDSGKSDPNATRGLSIHSIYFQYGLANRISIVGYIPFSVTAYQFAQVSETTGDILLPRGSLSSFGDAELGLEFGLFNTRSWVFSSTLKASLPTGNSEGITEQDTDNDELLDIGASFQTGDGEFNLQPGFNMGTGYSVGKTPSYFKSNLGYNFRTKGFSDELHIALENGFQFLDNRLLVLGALHLTKSMKNGDQQSLDDVSFFVDKLESLVARVETSFELFDHFGISFGLAHPVWGRLGFEATSISGGVYLDY
ncbi:MAG: hypothetical protein OXC92_08680 [Flavobacteriaceae bacterium]|nr:hypothetical protein [Flavobacteriaceae bacterium]MCY4217041.1 hypothetical protein [Flavobacteriaceae bacterium]MCY4253660.1 hypothetical protein [Flavobacteriaceae bacterium]